MTQAGLAGRSSIGDLPNLYSGCVHGALGGAYRAVFTGLPGALALAGMVRHTGAAALWL